ncbi:DUF2218 domain-containing protein [Salipiger sp. IMCC34102]|uniref:DUF2218 domain-containing protein n=1 Tax=Salipiger sp. IMCC34102 TaxID=2510647 RepID=UPI00101C6CF8|nr:DUF2218 domain-containing protein [Salipiger sp. IMCC34102]RYH02607.1 DUF2218 domain-containing protein [Salipiger sp. IMCC34102]
MQDFLFDRGTFRTEHASRYLQQLCKHFAHKTETDFDTREGRVIFAFGKVTLVATEQDLTIRAEAPTAEELARVRRVIDDHLVRFAFRENFDGMTWDGASSTQG